MEKKEKFSRVTFLMAINRSIEILSSLKDSDSVPFDSALYAFLMSACMNLSFASVHISEFCELSEKSNE